MAADWRACECGCGEQLPPDARANRKYIDGSHKTKAYRSRLAERAAAAGLPASVSLKVVGATKATHEPSRDGRERRDKRSRLSARASRDRLADARAMHDSMTELRHIPLGDVAKIARVARRIARLADRQKAHALFIETYGEEPHSSEPSSRAT